jgi:hypothetical protein
MTEPKDTDLVLGNAHAQHLPIGAVVLGGTGTAAAIYKELDALNLRWSNGLPGQTDLVVKGYLVAPTIGGWSNIDGLIDEQGRLWRILDNQISEWVADICSGDSHLFNCSMFGVTERLVFDSLRGLTTDYFKLNALCYATVRIYDGNYHAQGAVKSLAIIVDEKELCHRWQYQSDPSRWHNDNATHPNIDWRKIPPSLTPLRANWLKSLSKGDSVLIRSPQCAKFYRRKNLILPQPGKIERIGKKTIRVVYDDCKINVFYEQKALSVTVSIENGVLRVGQKPGIVYSWIEPASY